MVIVLKYEENKSIKFFFFKYWINDHLHRPVLWWHTMTRERLWQDMSARCFTSTCQMLMSHAVRYTPPAGSHVTVTHEWNTSIHVNNMERIWAFTVVIISAQFLHLCPTVCVCVCVTERLQLDFYCIFSHTNRQKGNFEILEEVHEDKIAKKMNCDFNKELMIFNKTLKQLCITHSLKNAFEDKCFRAFQPIFFWLAPNLYVPDEVTKSQK